MLIGIVQEKMCKLWTHSNVFPLKFHYHICQIYIFSEIISITQSCDSLGFRARFFGFFRL